MSQQPFVWEVHLRRDALEQLRDLPYGVWRDVTRSPLTKKVEGRDGKTYKITVSADWTLPGLEEIRVTVALQPGCFRRPLQESFIVRPGVAPPMKTATANVDSLRTAHDPLICYACPIRQA